jgi:hypothetical protein
MFIEFSKIPFSKRNGRLSATNVAKHQHGPGGQCVVLMLGYSEHIAIITIIIIVIRIAIIALSK